MGSNDPKTQNAPAPDVGLQIQVRQKDGKPFPGTVNVELRHQILSDRREARAVDGSKTLSFAGLRRAPQGIYKVTVTPTSEFAPQSQFVTIPASGSATIEVVFAQSPAGGIVAEPAHLQERAQLRSLLLTNPNYFGNVAGSPFQPVLKIARSTFYEEIGCVGLEPQLSLLEAVVYVKQSSGYSGDICSNGSKEYVRFYLSFDAGATWQDQGETHFTVYDVPAEARHGQRLEYACTLKIDPPRKECRQRNIPLARAILSWNVPNPPDTPHHVPVWGDVHDTHIQIAKRQDFRVKDVFDLAQVKLPEVLTGLVDLEAAIPPLTAQTLSAFQLHPLYRGKAVEPHRLALKEAVAYLEQGELSSNLLTADFKLPFADLADFNLADLFGPILAAQGSTRYEKLECLGYSPGPREALVGTVRVNLPFGYSGGPCTAGSREFVTFWADFDQNGSFETCLGQTSVNVHDFDPLPEGGLEYAVYLPFDFGPYRQKCKAGPRIVPIRAILSWNVQPPCGNPNFVPVWGNRMETTILLAPGAAADAQVPLLSRAGDISYIDINSAGLANGVGINTGFVAHDSPFGGLVQIAGKIQLGVPGLKYRIMKKRHSDPDTAWAPIVNEPHGIGLTISSWNPVSGWTTTRVVKHALAPVAEGYYEYEDYSANHFVESNIMGYWQTGAADDGGLFDLRIDLSVDGNPAHDLHSNVVTLLIDNTSPVAELSIDLGGQCGDFTPGTVFTGRFTASDLHFGGYSFEILPNGPPTNPPHGVLPVPAGGRSTLYGGAIADPGVTNVVWTVNTGRTPPAGEPHVGPMDPCGYAVVLHVRDRTNVNSGSSNNTARASVGFCLRRP